MSEYDFLFELRGKGDEEIEKLLDDIERLTKLMEDVERQKIKLMQLMTEINELHVNF